MKKNPTISGTSNRPSSASGRRKPGPQPGTKPDSGKDAQRKRFLSHLSTDGRIHASCKRARVPFSTVCRWRRSDPAFELEVQQTIALSKEKELERLEEIAVQRGTEGRSRPIFHYSKKRGEAIKVGEERIPSDLLLIARLRRLDPAYGTPGTKVNIDQRMQIAAMPQRLNDEQLEMMNSLLESITAQQQGAAPKMLNAPPQKQRSQRAPAASPTITAPAIEGERVEPIGDSAGRDRGREARDALRERLRELGPDTTFFVDSKKIF